MKALSIKQPWANMIVNRMKSIETRYWSTDYRGDLVIVSSKIPNIHPAGFALAIVKVKDCRRMREEDEAAARCPFDPRAFSWILTDVRKIHPVPIKGQKGLYNINLIGAQDEQRRIKSSGDLLF